MDLPSRHGAVLAADNLCWTSRPSRVRSL